MTAEQMETEIIKLREQVLHLEQKQEEQKRKWLWWSRIGAGFGLALLASDAYSRGTLYGNPSTTFYVMLFITLAFGSVAQPSTISTKTHMRNFALWAIVVLLLLALFTLFQFKGWI